LSQAAAPILPTDPTDAFIEYRIVWLPNSLTWYANGLAVRTVNRKDTWAEGEQRFHYPDQPARLSFSIWDSANSINPGLTQAWAGSLQPYSAGTQFAMSVKSVSVQCYSNVTMPVSHDTNSTLTTPSTLPTSTSTATAPTLASSSDLSNFGRESEHYSSADSSGSPDATSSPPDDLSKWLAEPVAAEGAPIFNLDNILDLMAGDDNGDVNFNAIVSELANNLGNVIDINEVGNMAATLGIMMSGMGAVAELQRQGVLENENDDGASNMLNSGIAALVGQMLADQSLPQLLNGATGPLAANGQSQRAVGNTNNIAANLQGLGIARLLNDIASNDGPVDANMLGLNQLVGNFASAYTQGSSTKQDNTESISNLVSNIAAGAQGGNIAETLGNVMAGGGARSVASALADFVNGNDSANFSGIAQAIGIRNFLRMDDKKVPEGCPSCFNCLYPGSVCAHNATCNQFTGRCDCPTGWTGEDCLQPACLSPLDEGKRPAAKSGHCHQDTECSPGWGGWNCNMCLADEACNKLNPTGEGGRCYNGSELITDVRGQCYIGNKGLDKFLPEGVSPKMTFGCNKNSSMCDAQFWVNGKESFYCDLDRCNIGRWGAESTAAISCQRMKCSCIPGRFLCGNYGLDISTVLDEIEGPVDIKCHDDGFSNCYIREPAIKRTLTSLIGDDAINMMCSVGQCAHYSQIPGYQKIVHETSKSNMLVGVATSLLTVYLVLKLIQKLVLAQDATSIGEPSAQKSLSLHNKQHTSAQSIPSGQKVMCSEISSMMMSTLKTTVSFRDICYSIPVQEPDLVSISRPSLADGASTSAESKISGDGFVRVLSGISGVVQSGEILAILGASGAGKSTLLDILSRREKCGRVTGKVQINERDLISDVTTNEFHRMSGYVDQQDLHVATATVFEAVMTSALLRLPRTMSVAAKEGRVRDVLVELGLWSVRDSKIGKNGARGISGGEMRRVSIACELVTSPSIIFLDEPTSGLDAYNAFVVMDTLSQLARRYGRTIICTIHQPRTDIFSMFDQLIVLAAGKMCYSGPAADISGYLESIGHPVPEGYNIADFSIDLVQQATVSSTDSSDHTLQCKTCPGGDNGFSKKAEIHTVNAKDEEETSDGEWSPLCKPSAVSLVSKTRSKPNETNPGLDRRSPLMGTPPKRAHFLAYNAHVSLPEIIAKFKESAQYTQIMSMLDSITGTEWSPSKFDMVSMIGSVPNTTPVTPGQQVAIIFSNLYDLTALLINPKRNNHKDRGFSDKLRPTLYEQFKVLSARIFRNLYRDPTLMLANYVLSVFIGLMCGVLFYQLDNTVQGVQNRLGLLMFVLAFYGFGTTTSLLVFSEERLLYLRERANAYYDPLAYFLAKVTFDLIPLRVVPPLLLTLIAYPMTGMAATLSQFVKFFSTLVLFNLTVASQMFFIGLLAEELVVSNFLASIMLLFSLLFGGLILNKESIPAILQPLSRISTFNLAYEALAINELRYAHVEEVRFGLEIQIPTATIISSFGFDLLAFWPDVAVLCGVLLASLSMSLLWLTYVIKERR
ncbi:(ABC) transporter, partial [Coemansia sp. BCRC 34301]